MEVRVQQGNITEVEADLIVVNLFEGGDSTRRCNRCC